MQDQPDPLTASPVRIATGLLLLSFATVLFTIALFRLLTFFIMPSLFFDLLFIGFPLGAVLGIRLFSTGQPAFLRSLWILQVVMGLSMVAMLACKHFDYLRAHMFEVQLSRLLVQMGVFASLFLPFFCGYGLSEYLGYQVGRKSLGGRMAVVYPLFLVGAAAAYFVVEMLLPIAGVSRVLVATFLCLVVAMLLLKPGALSRGLLLFESGALIGLLSLPDLDSHFVEVYKGGSEQSTRSFAQDSGYELVHQRWGDYSLVEIMCLKDSTVGDYYTGFYNDIFQWEFAPDYGFAARSIGMVPINKVRPGATIAIIGAGGGRQVRYAEQPHLGIGRIVAIEIESAVLDAVRGKFADEFQHVYEDPRVEVIARDARGYLEQSSERFDLIYLPSVGGYPQMMLEPGNMIRTRDAFESLRDRLTPDGVLAIWYPGGLDPHDILTVQYVLTLEKLGMQVRAYRALDSSTRSVEEILILGTRNHDVRLPSTGEMSDFLTDKPSPKAPQPPLAMSVESVNFPQTARTMFRPITDNQPFLAGNVANILNERQVYVLFGVVAGLLIAAGGVLIGTLRRIGDPGIPGRSFWQLTGMGLLIGANFLAIEHYVILLLFQRLYLFHDALVLGAIGFLIVSSLGSVLITPRLRPWCTLLSAVGVVGLLAQPNLPPLYALALLAPAALVTGSFFPALFDLAARNPVGVFAADAIGAAAGSITAFFLPIVFGFNAFYFVTGVLFLVTGLATHWFLRGYETEEHLESE